MGARSRPFPRESRPLPVMFLRVKNEYIMRVLLRSSRDILWWIWSSIQCDTCANGWRLAAAPCINTRNARVTTISTGDSQTCPLENRRSCTIWADVSLGNQSPRVPRASCCRQSAFACFPIAKLQASSNGMPHGSELDFWPLSRTIINWGAELLLFALSPLFKVISLPMLLLTLFFGLVAGQSDGMLTLL